ncbi:hypothetical protein TPY_3138 [Sulfobacillus acidophilus TPY]|uniref:Uncharacterized protein n=1 Tax=Sulfobacillus acidophilus (strain ATCC 700253 / DSM 10332 / NAL) TaxID=679936 RepID=G8TZZ5_SULAD|nr:hypothetical protein TPY_3138 [Sulfobacillus acidophilus TPY]AEW04164.1 hypothetical protein Sulac_0650 [Sulfobacillus acidophilus DSM 10332]
MWSNSGPSAPLGLNDAGYRGSVGHWPEVPRLNVKNRWEWVIGEKGQVHLNLPERRW